MICVLQNTPYKRITILMGPEWILDVIMCLNNFASQDGVSNGLYSIDIVIGKRKLDYDIRKITPGDYLQAYVIMTNTPKSRSIGSIILSPSNGRGDYYFIYVETGKLIHAYHLEDAFQLLILQLK